MANIQFKHLKLDKFVSGTEQRIFKTTTNIISGNLENNKNSFNLIPKKYNPKNIYYAKYSSDIIINNKLNNNKLLSGELINFHDINYDYLINRPDKISTLTIDNPNSPWFAQDALNAQYNIEKNKDERITYFPQHIDTPIDIAYSRNNSYFLLPINTKRFTNLVQSDTTLLHVNDGPNATFKPNYKSAFQELWTKAFYTPEDNSIPIYDLNFTFLQSINFGNNEKVLTWLKKYNLDTFTYETYDEYTNTNITTTLSSQILFDSETNTNNVLTADSIKIQPLLNVLSEYSYIFSETRKKEILQDLIANLDIFSTIRFLSPIGQITKLNSNVISAFTNDNDLAMDFIKENIFNISNNFNEQQDNQFSPEVLPYNILLGSDVRYALEFQNNKLEKEYFPSGYYNILSLKNNRNPHYEFNYFLPTSGYINRII